MNFKTISVKTMRTKIAVAVVAVIAALVGVHYLCAGLAGTPKFRTLDVTRGELFIGVTASGTVEPMEIIDVGAQIVGCVKSFGPDPDRPGKTIDFRSRVKQGGVLAQLDDLPHKAEVDRARVNLRRAEADVNVRSTRNNTRRKNTSSAPKN